MMASRPFPLREAHAHLLAFGQYQTFLDLSACASQAEVLELVRRNATEGWIVGVGARPAAWPEGDWPTLEAFDRVTGDRPALLWCFDYHAVLVNSKALAIAGLTASSADPSGGVLARRADGALTGVLLERAAHVAWACVPQPAEAQRPALLRSALDTLASLGYVEVHDLLSEPWLGPALAALDDRGELPVQVHLYPRLEHAAEVASGRQTWERDSLRLAGVKVFADGTLNSRTAWMLEPFADPLPDHPRGTPIMSPEQLVRAVREAEALRLPLATHAIGDGAVRAVLDAIETVRPRTSGFRIEHAEVVDEADVPRFAQLGVIASVQPCHLLTDIEAIERSLPHRAGRVLPLRALIDAGCAPGEGLIFGSDVPIVPADPRDSIVAATLRGRSDDPGRVAPEQAITEDEAWACFAASA